LERGEAAFPDQVLEVRMVEGHIQVARKAKKRPANDLHQRAEPVGGEAEDHWISDRLKRRRSQSDSGVLQSNSALVAK
jgi:hypothetical protein